MNTVTQTINLKENLRFVADVWAVTYTILIKHQGPDQRQFVTDVFK